MKLTFIGATHEVTGSCYYLEACGRRILIDYGMEQGENHFENAEIPIAPGEIDCVLLTHAHIDHSGLLPLLYRNGFRGPVYCTEATMKLCSIMLRDSAHIQMFEAEWRNRKGKRAGLSEYVPLYTMEDADGIIRQFEGYSYNQKIELFDGISVRFIDVGHLLGSSSIEVFITENGVSKKIVFSGDIGSSNQPLIRDPQYITQADYVVMESTYGIRCHEDKPDYVRELASIIQRTFDRGGNLVIPSFAVGRTQEMLYYLRQVKAEKLVRGHDNFTVYVDSPLAVEATNIFNASVTGYYDKEALELVRQGINPISFPGLKLSVTSDESKAINFDEEPKVIISASGMCEAGRIKHHLKHNLWRPESTVLFVGYQATGTLGRAILEGAKEAKLFGETIKVLAEIAKLPGVSSHADQTGLLSWIGSFAEKPKKVFVTHGDPASCDYFAELLKSAHGYDAYAPYSGTVFDLAAGAFVFEAKPLPIERREPGKPLVSAFFSQLLAAGNRLMAVIRKNEGSSNKDLTKFAKEINALCDKWER